MQQNIIVSLFILVYCASDGAGLPEICSQKEGGGADISGLRITCLGTEKTKITSIKQLQLNDIANEITSL